jgi:hypothetical protein
LPKDNEEVNVHVKSLKAMLDATMVADPVIDQEDGYQGHDDDHWRHPHGDLANNITPPGGHGGDNHDLCDAIHSRDACSQIESWHQDRERDKQE